MARTVKITRRTRSLGIAYTSHPSHAAPDEPTTTGTATAIAESLDRNRRSWGNHEAGSGHLGAIWFAFLYVGGERVRERPADVLGELDEYGHATVTIA